ncbi:MAG TPA: FAD-dependent oxidoreductase [Jatrophihabitantaceae bacterium]
MSVIATDVVVVGGGVMGSAAAWQLASRGADTVLLERFEPGHMRGASHGASRMFRFAYPDPFYARLAVQALPAWRDIEAAAGVGLLAVTGGVDHGVDAATSAIADALEFVGVPGQSLDPVEATRRWPGLRFDGRVLLHPASGRLDADAAVAALQKLAVAAGGQVHHHVRVTGIDDGEVVTETGDTYRSERVVVCAGAWTERLLGGHLRLPALRVTQEQPLHFAPRPSLASVEWPSFIHYRGQDAAPFTFGYGMRTPGEGIKVGFHHSGPECDPDARDFAPEASRLDVLLDYVREWVPGVDATAWTPISCTYTSTPTEDFVIDAIGTIVVAAGFSGHGFKFAPVVGGMLADLALGGPRPPARFALDREP